MTLTITFPPELECRLSAAAALQEVSVEEYTIRLLDAHVPRSPPLTAEERRKKLREAIEFWINEDDAEEQRETGEYLIRVLDEDRLSDRKLFPPELKGITW